jgi:hypothetical protein
MARSPSPQLASDAEPLNSTSSSPGPASTDGASPATKSSHGKSPATFRGKAFHKPPIKAAHKRPVKAAKNSPIKAAKNSPIKAAQKHPIKAAQKHPIKRNTTSLQHPPATTATTSPTKPASAVVASSPVPPARQYSAADISAMLTAASQGSAGNLVRLFTESASPDKAQLDVIVGSLVNGLTQGLGTTISQAIAQAAIATASSTIRLVYILSNGLLGSTASSQSVMILLGQAYGQVRSAGMAASTISAAASLLLPLLQFLHLHLVMFLKCLSCSTSTILRATSAMLKGAALFEWDATPVWYMPEYPDPAARKGDTPSHRLKVQHSLHLQHGSTPTMTCWHAPYRC